MTTLNEKSSITAGSCMFCNNESLWVNVIQGETVEMRICNSCLAEAHLTKFAPDGGKSPARKVVSNRKAVPALKVGSRRRR